MSFADEWDDVISGKLKWPFDEFTEFAEWTCHLQETPMDDWDLRRRGVNLLNDDGSIQRLVINPLHPEAQFGFHLIQRYGSPKFLHYFYRFYEMMRFLSIHRERLIHDGLVREPDDRGAPVEIKAELLQALCELPYTEERREEEVVAYGFSLGEVLVKTHELMEEEEDSDQ